MMWQKAVTSRNSAVPGKFMWVKGPAIDRPDCPNDCKGKHIYTNIIDFREVGLNFLELLPEFIEEVKEITLSEFRRQKPLQ